MQTSLLRMKKVAAIFDVPVSRAYEMARKGLIPGIVRVGRQVRVNPTTLFEFIEKGGKGLEDQRPERRDRKQTK